MTTTANCPFCQGAGAVPSGLKHPNLVECPDCDGEGVIASKRKEKPEPIGTARIRGVPRGHKRSGPGMRLLTLDEWPAIWEVLEDLIEKVDPRAELRVYFPIDERAYVDELLLRAGFAVDVRSPEESR